MFKLDWTVYYSGHGAMNYIEVMDDTGQVVSKIIVDAGCTDDQHEKVERYFEEFKNRLFYTEKNAPVFIFITHYHEDHFNFLDNIYKWMVGDDKPEIHVIFGSVADWQLRNGDPNSFLMEVYNLRDTIGTVDIPGRRLCSLISQVENIELYMLWNCLCPIGGWNDNSAAFLVRDTYRHVAFVFLGDMTGNTFLALLSKEEILSEMKELLDGYGKIITVPHHGSIKTLLDGNFVQITQDGIDMTPLVDAMECLSLDGGVYFISNGILDKFNHPDYMTAMTFRDMSARGVQFGQESVTAFMTYPYGNNGNGYWALIDTKGYALYATGRILSAWFIGSWVAEAYRIYVPYGSFEYSIVMWLPPLQVGEMEKEAFCAEPLVRVPLGLEETCENGEENSFYELFGTLGEMFFYEEQSLCVEDVLGKVKLDEYSFDGTAFEGNLDVKNSRLAAYESFLQGIRMTGTYKDGTLYGEAAITESMPSMSPLPLQIKEKAVVFESQWEQSGGSRVLRSKASLLYRGEFGKTNPLSVTVEYPLLQGTQIWEQFCIAFGAGKGLAVADLGSLLPELLGLKIDLLELMPVEVPFLTSVRLYELTLYRRGSFLAQQESSSELELVAVDFGYEQDAWKKDSDILSLDRLRFTIGVHLKGGVQSRCSASLSAYFTLLDQEVEVKASYPHYRLTFYNSTAEGIALARVASAYGVTLPTAFEDAVISAIRFDGALDFSEFCMELKIDSLLQMDVSALGKVVLKQISFTVAHGEGGNRLGMELLTVLKSEEKEVASFGCSADFTDGTLALKGNLMAQEDAFPAIYRAICGVSLPAGFPEIKLLSGELRAKYDTSFSIESYSMELEVTVSDVKVLGTGFGMNASLSGSGSGLVLKGSFVLADYFTIYAALSVQEARTAWKFSMLFAGVMLEISYESADDPHISGLIAADLSLQDAVNDLVRRLDPQRSYVPSADWKLLDAVNLKNTQLAYYYNRKEWELAVCPNLKLPFAKVDKLYVVMGSKGIEFRMIGQFLNETYTEEKPLKWDEGDSPKPTGDLLHINYLLMAQGILTDLPNEASVEKAVKALEQQIPPDDTPETLRCSPNAGVTAGMDLLVADAVQVQLVYNDYKPFYGARFYLYGDKAGVLKGLTAEVAYTRLSDTEGVFSGSITPPKALRNIRLGALTIGIGQISGVVYTNGSFGIDLGYPKERNFTQSFRLVYGVFEGLGGVYVKKGITGKLMLPKTNRGYFSPVLAMGIGLQLKLAKGVKVGPLSGNASLVMQGVFEGVYATYLPNDGGRADTFYRVSAQVSFDGKLQGVVDFGIIGVAVMLSIHAKSNLKLEAYCPVEVKLGLHVEAAASVKILFGKINFHFSLSFGLEFELDSGGTAPWAALSEHCVKNQSQPDSLPDMLRLKSVRNQAGRETITVHAAVNYGIADGQYTAVIFGLVSREDFAKIVAALGETAAMNGYLNCTDGEELFKKERFFRDVQWLYQFMETYFVLELNFNSAEIDEQSVIMPLPDCLQYTLTEYLENGDIRRRRRTLSEFFQIDAQYKQRLDAYYADTMYVQPEEADVRALKSGNTVSMAGQIFADYFELILKAVRAERENEKRNEREFLHAQMQTEQLDNIIGLVSRFLLGGKRGVTEAASFAQADGEEKEMAGLWALAGTQIDMPDWERVCEYCYQLQLTPGHPDWLRCAGGAESIDLTVPISQIRAQFPADSFPAEIFSSEPQWMKSCEYVDANQICAERVLQVKGENLSYYEAGENLMENIVYSRADEEQSEFFGFGILIRVTLQKCMQAKALYRMLGGSGFSLLREALGRSAVIDDIRLLYLSEPQDTQYTWYQEGDCIQLCNHMVSEADVPYASLTDREGFARLLAESGIGDGQNYFSFPETCPLTDEEQQEVYFAVHIRTENGYQNYLNCIVEQSDTSGLTLQGARRAARIVLPQGAAGLVVTVNTERLSEQEKLLAMQYQNMALEIEDALTHAVSHETIPFIGESGLDGETVYRMAVSYARALEGQDADVYHFVAEQRRIVYRLLWVDLFGNRMAAGKELSLVPKYTDRIIAVHNYPNISVFYEIREVDGAKKLCVRFGYDGNPPEDTSLWQQAKSQISQTDVSLRLYSELLSETISLDKDQLAAFLQQCLQAPGQSAELVYLADIRSPQDGAEWMNMRTWLYIFRRGILVDSDAPTEAAMVKSELVYKQEEALPESCCPFLGNGGAWQRLPVVTGGFTDGKTKVYLTAFDLQEVYQLFEEDFSYLNSPHAIEQLSRNQTLAPMLERLYQLRRQAAYAVAGRLRPLYEGAAYTDEDLGVAQQYAAQLLLKEADKAVKNVLFVRVKGDTVFSNETPEWYFEGQISGCTDYPLEAAADTRQIGAVGAVPDQAAVYAKELVVELESLRDEKRTQSYCPQGDAAASFRLAVPGDFCVQLPQLDVPEAPVYLRREEMENGCALIFGVRPLAQDAVYLRTMIEQPDETPEQNEAVCAMYAYAGVSRGIADKTTPEGITSLLPAMETYVKALGEMQDRIHKEEPEHKFYFVRMEGGESWQYIDAGSDAGISLECRYGSLDWYEMEKSGSRYSFDQENPPAYGDAICLKLVLKGQKTGQQAYALSVVREQEMEETEEMKRNRSFDQWSPEIRF